MAQTLNSLSWANCKIELSDNAGVDWRDVSGFTNAVSVDGGERSTAEFFTADGGVPIITAGKRAALEITIKAVYTEDATYAPFIMAQNAYDNHTPLMVRWSPKGGAIGDFRFTSAAGPCTAPVLPQGAADSSDAIPVEVTIKVPSITKSTIAV